MDTVVPGLCRIYVGMKLAGLSRGELYSRARAGPGGGASHGGVFFLFFCFFVFFLFFWTAIQARPRSEIGFHCQNRRSCQKPPTPRNRLFFAVSEKKVENQEKWKQSENTEISEKSGKFRKKIRKFSENAGKMQEKCRKNAGKM